jgi:hypothetical protein
MLMIDAAAPIVAARPVGKVVSTEAAPGKCTCRTSTRARLITDGPVLGHWKAGLVPVRSII